MVATVEKKKKKKKPFIFMFLVERTKMIAVRCDPLFVHMYHLFVKFDGNLVPSVLRRTEIPDFVVILQYCLYD